MRDPFDDGRSFWAQNFTPRETAWLIVWAIFLTGLWALVLLR